MQGILFRLGKMESLCASKMKSWLIIFIILMVSGIEGGCIEEERKALLQFKTSFIDSYGYVAPPLLSWVDDGGECCDWERVNCNTTTTHVTNLSLSHIVPDPEKGYRYCKKNWALNVSVFLDFKELTSLNLSWNCLDDGIVNTGLGRLSSLKKLEILDLSDNSITNKTFPSLGALTSLRVLNLGDNHLEGYFLALALENLEILDLTGNIKMKGFEQVSLLKKLKVLNLSGNKFSESFITSLSALPMLKSLDLSYNQLDGMPFPAEELAHLTNLEELDLSWNNFNDTPSIQECTGLSRLKKLKSITLVENGFNKGIIPCLSALPSLKTLDLSFNMRTLGGSFPIQELAHLTNLEELDLSGNLLNDTPSIQECTGLSGLKKLKSITLGSNNFNKSIISCLSALPSLKTLDLSFKWLGGSFPIQELSQLSRDLEVLLLSSNGFNGTLPMEALASHFHHLEVLDLSWNHFVGSIPSTIQALSSLRVVSFANNNLHGSLPEHGLCELKNLQELVLSHNMFDGTLPHCFNRLLSLKLLDISSNRFTGTLTPSPIANLTSLEYIDFGNNAFEGSFSLSSLSNNTELVVVRFVSNNNKFAVETEEPLGWIPMFQLEVLVLSSCNMNRQNGSVVTRFLHHQRMLHVIDLSDNSLVGQFPNWLIDNNTLLRVLILRNNSFSGIIHMPLHTNANMWWLDVSENHKNGTIPGDIQKFLPNVQYLNLSGNSLHDVIPSSIGGLRWLQVLDLSDNELSGEVPKGLLTNHSSLIVLKLSKNRLHGDVLSGNLSLGRIERLHLDSNRFSGKIGNWTNNPWIQILDISNNSFIGTIPHWISNSNSLSELVVSNNHLEGMFPCGTTSFSFLDISLNSFSGPIPSCLNFQYMKHLHMGSNGFTGSIPNAFRNLIDVLILDIGNNSLSGKIPEFLGELSDLRILILGKNNFSGYIPMQLCQLSNVSLIDLSRNSLSGSIPRCLQNITTPIYPTFMLDYQVMYRFTNYNYQRVLQRTYYDTDSNDITLSGTQDEVQFTTKTLSLAYKGSILDYMVGLDLSGNKLTGDIPKELGSLIEIRSLNLSHNKLLGPIPASFSNLAKIESLDLSSNNLSDEVPSQLIELTSLAVFNVSYNNLSGGLPEMKAQFSTFTKKSYEGNPLLCGPPLEKKCTATLQVIDPSAKEGNDKWHDIDMASFYGSCGATWVVFLLGFGAVLYINPYWRRRWLDFVEECMYTCYYFFDDCVRKVRKLFRK